MSTATVIWLVPGAVLALARTISATISSVPMLLTLPPRGSSRALAGMAGAICSGVRIATARPGSRPVPQVPRRGGSTARQKRDQARHEGMVAHRMSPNRATQHRRLAAAATANERIRRDRHAARPASLCPGSQPGVISRPSSQLGCGLSHRQEQKPLRSCSQQQGHAAGMQQRRKRRCSASRGCGTHWLWAAS